jgi:group II intron reverse transcriptase/maturase
MNRVNEESLAAEHRKQERKKATGIDGVTKDEYGANLEANVEDLIARMKEFSYKPQAVRRTYIPKANGKLRPLGIPAYEDRLVQGAMAGVLNEIYEERFLDCSYGFRPKRSAHDVVKHVNDTVMTGKVNYVLEADIKGFFDNVDHEWLMKFLEHDIADKNFLRYIKRFLIAGVMEDGERRDSDKGTPQGGLISPILANVYLHYVLDLWVERKLKKECGGDVYYVRYADDFLLMFQYECEARQTLDKLRERLGKFNLEVAEDKTRILPFGRFKGTKGDFDFLGFTFFNTKTRSGKYRIGIRTSKTKLKAKKLAVKGWLKDNMHKPVAQTMKKLNIALQGHFNYYGVNGNIKKLQDFYKYVEETCMRMLNRRSQKRSLAWDKFRRIWDFYIKPPSIRVNIWN